MTAFKRMFEGQIKATESLGGFGTFAKIFEPLWEWIIFGKMTAIISLILAFMNLLPIPALDGGHVMFLFMKLLPEGNQVTDLWKLPLPLVSFWFWLW
ncbi:MAG: site-2 protease family protein [Saprospiraceae bacterium]